MELPDPAALYAMLGTIAANCLISHQTHVDLTVWAQYEDIYRLCHLRGPEGIIVGLAERLG